MIRYNECQVLVSCVSSLYNNELLSCHTHVVLVVQQALCMLQALVHAADLRGLDSDILPQTLQLCFFRYQLASTLSHLRFHMASKIYEENTDNE